MEERGKGKEQLTSDKENCKFPAPEIYTELEKNDIRIFEWVELYVWEVFIWKYMISFKTNKINLK